VKLKEKIKRTFNKIRRTRNANIREISYDNLKKLIREETNFEIVDIRSPQEFAENRIKFAINIPLYDLQRKCREMLPDKDKLIILYCEYGSRSKKAYQILESRGYTNLYSLKGGIDSAF